MANARREPAESEHSESPSSACRIVVARFASSFRRAAPGTSAPRPPRRTGPTGSSRRACRARRCRLPPQRRRLDDLQARRQRVAEARERVAVREQDHRPRAVVAVHHQLVHVLRPHAVRRSRAVRRRTPASRSSAGNTPPPCPGRPRTAPPVPGRPNGDRSFAYHGTRRGCTNSTSAAIAPTTRGCGTRRSSGCGRRTRRARGTGTGTPAGCTSAACSRSN